MSDRAPRKSPRRPQAIIEGGAPKAPEPSSPSKGRGSGVEVETSSARRVVNKVRSPHGTRVAMRIVCSACNASDTIDFAPRDPKAVLCRRCAFERYGALDPDDTAVRTRREKCAECRNDFEVVHNIKEEPPYICSDCKSGIITQQKDRSAGGVRVSPKIMRARRKVSGEIPPDRG